MNDVFNITLNNKQIKVPKDIKLIDLVNKYNFKKDDVIGVKINNEIASFNSVIKNHSIIDFLYAYDEDGNKMYKSGLKFVLIAALNELYNDVEVFFEHSIDKGICFTIKNIDSEDQNIVNQIKEKMNEIIKQDEQFIKLNVAMKDAIEFYKENNEIEKALNVQNTSNQILTIYKLMNNYNYFYTDMPYSTKCLNKYDITYLGNNKYVLLFPVINNKEDSNIPTYTHYPLNMLAFSSYKSWISQLNILNVPDLNNLVSNKKIEDFIYANELYLQKNILNEARVINDNPDIKVVLIAGPTSSGKTTTSKKLARALQTYGKEILTISIDDYYLDQTHMPKENVENHDFESFDLIDKKLLDSNIDDLLDLKSVLLPRYDFKKGAKIFDREANLKENTIIIVEGMHALNDKLLTSIEDNKKYKIYVSPFMPLTIDRHNHLSTVDLRLLRRIVRDNNFRGTSVEETLKCWHIVREAEEKNIFPYMNEVDSVLNTSLIYEIGVLKVYAEPLLYSVSIKSSVYEEARRLIEFLKIFYPVPSEYINKDSLLREFIGGSIFR